MSLHDRRGRLVIGRFNLHCTIQIGTVLVGVTAETGKASAGSTYHGIRIWVWPVVVGVTWVDK